MVGANTFRNPGLTAKLATTLDHISGGRAVLGIGGAWFEREHDAFGIDFGLEPGRAARPAGRVGDAHAPAARRRAVQPRGPLLHDARRAVRAAPDPGPPADPGRRLRAAEDAADRGAAGRCVEHRGLARGGPRPLDDPRRALLGRRARHRDDREDHQLPDRHPRRRGAARRGGVRGAAGPQRGRDDGRRPSSLGSPDRGGRRAYGRTSSSGFETVIVRMPAPYDRETIERMAEVARAPRREPMGSSPWPAGPAARSWPTASRRSSTRAT